MPENENARLSALRRYQLLDTDAEAAFDDIAKLAAFICRTPIALVSLVDATRQWFKARVGLSVHETDREHAFCAHTILQNDLLIVNDALEDARFADNPLVTGSPQIRFYAGAPLISPDGFGLGALCVIDRRPGKLSPEQAEALGALARLVVGEMELRRVSAELAVSVEQVKTLGGLLPICSHCKGIRDDQGYWQNLEAYFEENTEACFTHSICPVCMEKHYPSEADDSEAADGGEADLSVERDQLAQLLRTHRKLVAQTHQSALELGEAFAARKDARQIRMKRHAG